LHTGQAQGPAPATCTEDRKRIFWNISIGICFLLFFIGLAWSLISEGPVLPVSGNNKLVVGKPFGPSAARPDPALHYNGWYLSEAGVTETLFHLDFSLHLQPLLAASYKQVDPLSWEVSLKQGIQFHDHSPLNAEAVKWSLERIIDPKSEVFNKRLQGLLDINSITVQDEHTLLFRTNSPNAAFLFNLTAPGTAILSPASNTKRFFSTGPFLLEKMIPNQEMILRSFANYWQGKQGFEQVSLKIITNPATRMLAFEAGQLDLAVNFPAQDAVRLQGRDDVQIVQQPTTRLCFLFVRVSDGPLADSLIRQALNYALDREEIVQAVLAGQGGTVAASVFPAILPWVNQNLHAYPYNAQKAAQLLAQAGLEDKDGDGMLELHGHPLVLNIWTYEGRAALKPALELMQAQLKRVGVARPCRGDRCSSVSRCGIRPRKATRISFFQKSSPHRAGQTSWVIRMRNWMNWSAKERSPLIQRNGKKSTIGFRRSYIRKAR
jgi:peptide/nickel transport system substrate-binding protein